MSSRLSQNIFRLPEIKEKFEKFREFKCDQPVFVHFRKDWVFDIKNSTKFLSTQKSTFLTIFFPKVSSTEAMQEEKSHFWWG